MASLFYAMSRNMRWADGFIAVDWGTTNRRAYRIDAGGKCVDEFEDDKGMLSVPEGGFPAAVAEIRKRLGDMPLLLAGMVGSNRGWKEAPYVACPAGLDELVNALVWAGSARRSSPAYPTSTTTAPTSCAAKKSSCSARLPPAWSIRMALVCHPGTHNKWVTCGGARSSSFRTVMTGELFSLLKEHSILADLLQGPVEVNDVFKQAARCAIDNEALPAELFSVRARVLLGQAKKEDAASYASGLLDRLRCQHRPVAADSARDHRDRPAGTHATSMPPRSSEAGRDVVELDGERCFLAGIHEIAKRI